VIFTRENSFTKQILIFWNYREYDKAYELSMDFTKSFPRSLIAHYLLAKYYIKREEYPMALAEGHRAFNLAQSPEDLIATGVFLACAYYHVRRYSKGYEILNMLREYGDEKVEKALIILSLCMNDPTEAMMHVDALYVINKDIANKFVDKFLEMARSLEPPMT
jgi:tetratricopeptide (TPR) repeat protein